MDNHTLIIDQPEPGVLILTLGDISHRIVYAGPVDNILLTEIDNLLTLAKLRKSVLQRVSIAPGIDNNSSLYRIVQSVAAAVQATRRTAE